MNLNNWYYNKKTPVLIFITITIILIYTGRNISIGNHSFSNDVICRIEFSYMGMDSSFIEKEITIPLEKRFSTFMNLNEIKSVTEDSKSILFLFFEGNSNRKKLYLQITEETNDFYESLNIPVQKPRIYFDDKNTEADFIFAVFSDNSNKDIENKISKELIPLLEGIEEVSLVKTYGNEENEIKVVFDKDKCLSRNILPQEIALVIEKNTPFNSSVTINSQGTKDYFTLKTGINNFNEWGSFIIKNNNQSIKLSDISEIFYNPKDPEEIVRLNGKECIEIEVKAKSKANTSLLSSKCKKILNDYFSKEDYVILLDSGKEQNKVIKKLLWALVQSLILVVAFIPFFFKDRFITLTIILFLPVSLLWTILLISSFGIELNPFILSGTIISLGIIIDPILVMAEEKTLTESSTDYIEKFRKLVPSLTSSAGTNVIVFIPFFFIKNIIPGVDQIVLSMVIMILVSFSLALFFFPCIFYRLPKTLNSTLKMHKYKSFNFISRNNCILIYGIMIIFAILCFFFFPKDYGLNSADDIASINIEFNPEKRKEVIDESIKKAVSYLNEFDYFDSVISICRKGNCELKMKMNRKINSEELENISLQLKAIVQDGFIFIDDGKYIKSAVYPIEIAIEGEDSEKCREYAKIAASEFNSLNSVHSAVLNFKESEKSIMLVPFAEYLIHLGSSSYELAENLYWQLGTPVINKFWKAEKEYDVRLLEKSDGKVSLEDLKSLQFSDGGKKIKICDVASIKEFKTTGKIYKKNNRTCAFMTVYFKNLQLKKAKKIILETFRKINMAEGYNYSLDKKTLAKEENLKTICLSFLLSIILLFVFLTAINEKPMMSLIILSIIPASFAFPFFIKVFHDSCLGIGDFIGMAVSAGIVVNNGILIENFGTEKNKKSIFITNLTTIIGSIPILFSGSEGFICDLAFYMLFSSTGALFLSFAIFPKISSGCTLPCKDSLQVQ